MRKLATALLLLLPLFCTAGERRVIILRAEFADCKFTMDDDRAAACVEKVQDYFNDQFGQETSFTFDLGPAVCLEKNLSYYGANTTVKDAFINKAVIETCEKSAMAGVVFSPYDSDGNGTVDNVCIIFAGDSENSGAGSDHITSQQEFLSNWSVVLPRFDQKWIDSFSVSSESDGIGSVCHEFAHSLGLIDLYDTDGEGSGGLARGLWGTTALMDEGDHNDSGCTPPNFNAIDYELLGLGQAASLQPGTFNLAPLRISREYLKSSCGPDGSYYLVECRDNEGWDAFTGYSGIAVYHIDKSNSPAGWSDYFQENLTAAQRWERNQVNCRPDRQCAELLSFGKDNCSAAQFAITGISIDREGTATFSVVEPLRITESVTFQDAAIICWEADASLGTVESFEIRCGDAEGSPDIVATVDGSARTHTIEGLSPYTQYKVTVSVAIREGAVFSTSTSIRTKVWREDVMPYIYLSTATRTEEGFRKGDRIPLRVYNAPNADRIEWTLDGRSIKTGPDGYYTLDTGGTLKAKIIRTDGTCDIIVKKLNIIE